MLISSDVLDRRCDIIAKIKVMQGQREVATSQVIARGVPVGVQITSSQSRLLTDLLGFHVAADLTFTMNGPHKVQQGYQLRLDDGKVYTVSRVDHYPSESRLEYQTGTLSEDVTRGP